MPNYYSYDLKCKIINLYLNNSYTVIQLTNLFNISKSSIYNWIKLYNNGTLKIKKDNFIKNNSFFRNPIIRVNIKFYIIRNPNFIYKKLISYIFNKTNILICKSTLFDIIKDLNFTKKIVNFKKNNNTNNVHKIIELRKKNCNINFDNIISIDEVSFDTNIIHNKAWSIKGETITKFIKPTYKRNYCYLCNF